MTPDDLRKLSTSPTLFNLDRLISPRIIKVLYLLGLAAIVMWAITHLFATFGASFGEGLWGLLEIAVYGLLAFVGLRIVCEAAIVFFRQNETAVAGAAMPKPGANLLDDVKDALEELAEDDVTEESRPKAVTARSSASAATPTRKRTRKPRASGRARSTRTKSNS